MFDSCRGHLKNKDFMVESLQTVGARQYQASKRSGGIYITL